MELEEELKVVGNSLKSLEVSEEKVGSILRLQKLRQINWKMDQGWTFILILF